MGYMIPLSWTQYMYRYGTLDSVTCHWSPDPVILKGVGPFLVDKNHATAIGAHDPFSLNSCFVGPIYI